MDTLNPVQQVFENQLTENPIIKELKENDELIMKKLGSLEIGQTEIEERLDEGAAQFKLLWTEVSKMNTSMDNLSQAFKVGIETLHKDIFHNKLDAAISNNTILVKENEELKHKLEKKESKDWDIKKIIIASILSLVILGLAIALGLKQA